ncbi:hypothetical protein [Vibrio phage VCPH]|nr:hypothetical protein [Vibrio phage VCPH]
MRLPDPFTLSVAPGFSEARLSEVDPKLRDEMADGSVLKTQGASQYWKLDITYPDLFADEFAIIMSALMEAKRTGDTIDVLLPQHENFRVTGDTTLCNIASGQKGSQVVITGFSNLTGQPAIGDLFKLSGYSKVYKITTVQVAGDNLTLTVYPDLAHETDGSEKPVFNEVLFEMILSNDQLPEENPSTDGLYRGVEFSLREQING